MVGIDPASDFTVGPWLREHLGGRLGENEIIVGANAHIFLGRSSSTVGDSDFFFGRELRVAGVLDPTGLGLDEAAFVTLETAYSMARESEQKASRRLEIEPGQISALMVNLNSDASRSAVAKRIELEIPGAAVVTSRELFSSSVARQLETLTPGLLLIGSGFWLIAVLMIGAMFSTLVASRLETYQAIRTGE